MRQAALRVLDDFDDAGDLAEDFPPQKVVFDGHGVPRSSADGRGLRHLASDATQPALEGISAVVRAVVSQVAAVVQVRETAFRVSEDVAKVPTAGGRHAATRFHLLAFSSTLWCASGNAWLMSGNRAE